MNKERIKELLEIINLKTEEPDVDMSDELQELIILIGQQNDPGNTEPNRVSEN